MGVRNPQAPMRLDRPTVQSPALSCIGTKADAIHARALKHYETVNQLTDAAFDRYSMQPSYQACVVRLIH